MGSRLLIAGAVAAALVLAGCGVDGAPERPSAGVSVGGTVEIGVSGGAKR